MRRLRAIPAAVALLFGLALAIAGVRPVAAQDAAAITIEAAVLPDTLTVGDPVTLTISVTHPAGYRVVPVAADTPLGAAELLTVAPATITPTADGRETTVLPLIVTAWETGALTTAPFELRVSDRNGELSLYEVPPVALTVQSVLQGAEVAPRDIKPQATLPLPILWPYWVAGALLLAIVGTLAGLWIGRRRAAEPLPADAVRDTRPAHLVALSALDAIEQADYVGRGDFDSHYTLTADTLRRYVEQAWRIAALERTTAELRASLRAESALNAATRQQLINLLQHADIVKFARLQPDDATARALPDEARRVVQASHAQLDGTLPAADADEVAA